MLSRLVSQDSLHLHWFPHRSQTGRAVLVGPPAGVGIALDEIAGQAVVPLLGFVVEGLGVDHVALSFLAGYVRRLLRTNSTIAAQQATTERPSKNP